MTRSSALIARRAVLASLAAMPFAGRAFAQALPVATPVGPVTVPAVDADLDYQDLTVSAELQAWIDAFGRPTAKVMLGDLGPFDFLVDTGANTTVVSMTRAIEAGGVFTGTATVNGTTGSAELPLARLPVLSSGVVRRRDIRVAVLPDTAFREEHGILGADVFAGRRLTFDIPAKIVRVEPTKRQGRLAPISNLRMRNGLLAELPGRIGKVKVKLMLDTGAQHCIINPALDRELKRLHPGQRRVPRIRVTGVTGQTLIGEFIELPRTELGGLELLGASAVAVDAPIFHVWDLVSEPAMIVGVDVLSRLEGFSIDYGSRRFEGKPVALLAGQARLAVI